MRISLPFLILLKYDVISAYGNVSPEENLYFNLKIGEEWVSISVGVHCTCIKVGITFNYQTIFSKQLFALKKRFQNFSGLAFHHIGQDKLPMRSASSNRDRNIYKFSKKLSENFCKNVIYILRTVYPSDFIF